MTPMQADTVCGPRAPRNCSISRRTGADRGRQISPTLWRSQADPLRDITELERVKFVMSREVVKQ